MGMHKPIGDQDGDIAGIWIENPADANNEDFLRMCCVHYMQSEGRDASELHAMLVEGKVTVHPNRIDENGGVFVMKDGVPPPGGQQAGSNADKNDDACFVATACYGSSMAKEVHQFRAIRDLYLLGSLPGRTFIHLYYRYGRYAAVVIARSRILRLSVRQFLLRPILAIFQDDVRKIQSSVAAKSERHMCKKTSESSSCGK